MATPVDRSARAEGWDVLPAAFRHARAKGRRWLTYAEWDRVFGELASMSAPAVLGRAIARRKAHVEDARAAGETAEAEALAWRRETIGARWHRRCMMRANERDVAAHRKRGR